MVDMKPVAQGAGRRREFLTRAGAMVGVAALTGCTGAGVSRSRSGAWLEPMYGFTGATLTDKTDPSGFPMAGGKEIFLPFLYPVAAVASLGAIFIADAGLGRLFRYDRGSGLMAAIPGIRIVNGSKLQAAGDGTVYLLDPFGSELWRYSMHGGVLPAMSPRLPTNRYLDFAVEAGTGRVFAVDVVHKVVDRIEPVGHVALPHIELDGLGAIALDGASVFVADGQCGCVREWRNGLASRRLASGAIRQPVSMAAEHGEIYLLDAFDRTISRVDEGGLETIFPNELNLVSPQQIFVSNGMMYVADGVNRSVAVFRIRRRHP